MHELDKRTKEEDRKRALYMIERFAEAGMPNCISVDDRRIIYRDYENDWHINGEMPISSKDDESFIQRFIAKFRGDIDE